MTAAHPHRSNAWMGPRGVACVLCAQVLAGCAATPPTPDLTPEADPLIGRVIAVDGRHELTRDALLERLENGHVIYLGEKHDNRYHHRIQLELLHALLARGHRPAVALEVISREQTSALMTYVTSELTPAGTKPSPEDWLRRRLGWDSKRDERWAAYGPLIELARAHRLTVVGIDLPTALRLRIVAVGIGDLTHVERGLLRPSGFDDAAYESLMLARLKRSHCGRGSDAYLKRLYQTWLARNDAMASAIVDTLAHSPDGLVFVVLGAGHVQHGMGVYERVAARRPELRQLNLGLREVAANRQPLEAYLEQPEAGGVRFSPDHDYVWFTPAARVNAGDPCAALTTTGAS